MISVCVAHYDEPIKWVDNIKYNVKVISNKEPNKDNEASSYLQYIIENYDNLSEYTYFIRGHRTSYYHEENLDEKINRLIPDKPYYNINEGPILFPDPECHSILYMVSDLLQIINVEQFVLNVQDKISSQFYVHKSLIRRHSKHVYIKIQENSIDIKVDLSFSGWAFEYIWHLIFTGINYEKE